MSAEFTPPVLPTSNIGATTQAAYPIAYLIQMSRAARNQGGQIKTPISPMLVIGSDPSCGVRLNDPTVNPRHARLELRTGKWILRDLQSHQGVFINETRVSEAPLEHLDRIRVGEAVLIFKAHLAEEPGMSSKNEDWNRQLERIPAFASTDFPVLMIGPTGAGKDVLARAIHNSSKRRENAFQTINCGALSESLIESELFGHVRGSFTGAAHDRKGAFEAARGGTLFLDEIGDLPLSLQSKLLRAIENKEIRPVGSDRTVETDVRILAATHKNLETLVRRGLFREDLYWRLDVCKIEPPPLKNRMEDFTDLVYFFCKQMRVRLSFNAIEHLRTHDWPGNIRELRNVIARAAAYFPGHYVQVEDIEPLVQRIQKRDAASESKNSLSSRFDLSDLACDTNDTDSELGLGQNTNVMREIEREMIIRRLVANRGNQRRTAADLGMPKSTLHDRLKTYSIDVNEIKELA
ncbi:MAG: sigma 54-interacting transcriptional regulator [Bdellovibrionales bacterium]|jgi:transcriptional regulator with GAF, ATPase, and Fis domain|nr:sigma 54-interacting transcriptional regulator [Bdellovibrionales bacterium]